MNSPVDKRDRTDSGDETLRRFRYQFACGVALLIDSAIGILPYKAIWCEQLEDILAEIEPEKLFDAYQIKTMGHGSWELNDRRFQKSISRFIEHDQKYPGRIKTFVFYSNAPVSSSSDKTKAHLSPINLLKSIQSTSHWTDLNGTASEGFKVLNQSICIDPITLYSVLKRMEIVTEGLSLRSFESEIANLHIDKLDRCVGLSNPEKLIISNTLISRIAEASSLVSYDLSRDWFGLNGKLVKDPYLSAKKVSVQDVIQIVSEHLDSRQNPYTKILNLIEQLKHHINNSEDNEIAELLEVIYEDKKHLDIGHDSLIGLQNSIEKLYEIANNRKCESINMQSKEMHVSITRNGLDVYLLHIYKFEKMLLNSICGITNDLKDHITSYLDGQLPLKKVIDAICVRCALNELLQKDATIHKCKIEVISSDVDDEIDRIPIRTAYKAVANLGGLLKQYQNIDQKLTLSLAEEINMIMEYTNRFSILLPIVERKILPPSPSLLPTR